MSVDKGQILRDLDAAWADVREAVEAVPEDRVSEPGVVEQWSVKDLLGHMAFWAAKAAGDLEALAAGQECEITTPGGEETLNEWNAREAEARSGKSLAEVREEWLSTFEAARRAFEATPAEKLGTEVLGWPQLNRFLGDTTIHYREHEQHIREWLKTMEGKRVNAG